MRALSSIPIGGLFMLLFAQTLTNVSQMHGNQIDITNRDRVMATFRDEPVEMSVPLGALMREQLRPSGSLTPLRSTWAVLAARDWSGYIAQRQP